MTVFEMVKRDLKEQGVHEAEIQVVLDQLIEDANWREYLRGVTR